MIIKKTEKVYDKIDAKILKDGNDKIDSDLENAFNKLIIDFKDENKIKLFLSIKDDYNKRRQCWEN